MSAFTDRYSLDFDPEFAAMVERMKNTHLRSSGIEKSPMTLNCNIRGGRSNRLTCSPATPTIIDLTKSRSWSPSPIPSVKEDKLAVDSEYTSNIIKIDDVIHLDNCFEEASSEEDEEVMAMDNIELDLNATYSDKTMNRYSLSVMQKALKESEDVETAKKNEELISKLQKGKLLSTKNNHTPSPHTPINQIKLKPERSYRLAHVPSCSHPSPLSNFVTVPPP